MREAVRAIPSAIGTIDRPAKSWAPRGRVAAAFTGRPRADPERIQTSAGHREAEAHRLPGQLAERARRPLHREPGAIAAYRAALLPRERLNPATRGVEHFDA